MSKINYDIKYGETKGYKQPIIKKGKDFIHFPEIIIRDMNEKNNINKYFCKIKKFIEIESEYINTKIKILLYNIDNFIIFFLFIKFIFIEF